MQIAADARLDWLYIVRTNVAAYVQATDVVRHYEAPTQVGRPLLSPEAVGLHIRPIQHWVTERARTRVSRCIGRSYL